MQNKPMKVLSVCTNDSSGGAARAAHRIHEGVRALGVESRMFVKDKQSNDENVVPLAEFVPSHPLCKVGDWVAKKVKNKWQHAQWNRYPQRDDVFMSDLRSTRLHGALQELDYDVLHLHWINQRFVPLPELKKTHKPIVWTLHDSWPFTGICHLPYECKGYQKACGCCPFLHSDEANDLSHQVWANKRRCYAGLDLHIVAPSRWLADCARNSALFHDADIRVIPNCVNTDVFCPGVREEACAHLGLDPVKRYVAFGAVNVLTDENKGLKELVLALNRLEDSSVCQDLELLVYGTESMDGFPNVPFPVRCLGVIKQEEQMVNVYRCASLTVVPSRSENLSCTIMESLSCGTPVAAFDIGGNGDMIDHKENGYLARERDDVDLANGILWCLENNSDGALSKAARQKVLDNYTPEIVARQYESLYRSLT